jgi:hypothetical protein
MWRILPFGVTSEMRMDVGILEWRIKVRVELLVWRNY